MKSRAWEKSQAFLFFFRSVFQLYFQPGQGRRKTHSVAGAVVRLPELDWIHSNASLFFPVEDRFETEVGADMFPEWITLEQREGCYKAFRRVTFQQDRLKVISEKDGDPSKTYKLNRPSHNELTSFLVLRTLPLKAGQSVFVETFASDKSYTVEVKVIKRERLQTYFGEVNAIKVRPELPFKTVQEQKGEFYAWFTDDQRRLPIKLQGGVILGSMVGILVEWQVDDKPIFRNPES